MAQQNTSRPNFEVLPDLESGIPADWSDAFDEEDLRETLLEERFHQMLLENAFNAYPPVQVEINDEPDWDMQRSLENMVEIERMGDSYYDHEELVMVVGVCAHGGSALCTQGGA